MHHAFSSFLSFVVRQNRHTSTNFTVILMAALTDFTLTTSTVECNTQSIVSVTRDFVLCVCVILFSITVFTSRLLNMATKTAAGCPAPWVKVGGSLNHISVKSFGAEVRGVLVGEGMKGRILCLHSCGIWGQSSKMKGHLSSDRGYEILFKLLRQFAAPNLKSALSVVRKKILDVLCTFS